MDKHQMLNVLKYFACPTKPIDHDELIEAISTPEAGAVVFFSGLVRGTTQKEGHIPQTEYLEYEAYESMALAKMQQVAREIREQYPDVLGIAMVQRLGKLAVGDNTVLIACSSAHRDSGCFEAARYGIDRLKEIVPVWKKKWDLMDKVGLRGIINRHLMIKLLRG
jgi:molybdopterin synthase catalytic subunit